jgi:hypothetical protein
MFEGIFQPMHMLMMLIFLVVILVGGLFVFRRISKYEVRHYRLRQDRSGVHNRFRVARAKRGAGGET